MESRFPENLPVDLDDMMRVFYAHITGTASVSRAGTVVIKLAKSASNVSSYFTGMNTENPIMINLLLELIEKQLASSLVNNKKESGLAS